jgi:putative membrane protein
MSNLILDITTRAAEHPGWAGGWGGPWWLLFPLIGALLLGSLIWLLARRRDPVSGQPTNHAVEILAARYARGEIDTEEYRRRLDEIRGLA